MPTEAELVQRLRDHTKEKYGHQKRAAQTLGVSQSYFNQMCMGTKPITDDVLADMGIRRVVTYEPIDGNQKRTALDDLSDRVAALEDMMRRNAPAMSAAWMSVPIGGRTRAEMRSAGVQTPEGEHQ